MENPEAADLEKSRQETRDSFKNRGVLYRLFFEEFSREIGEEKTAEIMKRAIYRWGGNKSGKFRHLAEKKDFAGVAEEFVKTSVCGGALFKPAVDRVDEKSAVIDMFACPLVDAWKEMGLHCDDIAKMCDIANATDYGKYEGMGFELAITSTVARSQDRCRLVIRKKKS